MKTKKLVKNALKHPELYDEHMLVYLRKWLEYRKAEKQRLKARKQSESDK